ncbi:MAG: hypothetical protein WCI67_18730, partial [Chloroflexales bacterium]
HGRDAADILRARAAADFRDLVCAEDIRRIAPMALLQRHSLQLDAYARSYADERAAIDAALASLLLGDSALPATRRKRSTVRKIEGEA